MSCGRTDDGVEALQIRGTGDMYFCRSCLASGSAYGKVGDAWRGCSAELDVTCFLLTTTCCTLDLVARLLGLPHGLLRGGQM